MQMADAMGTNLSEIWLLRLPQILHFDWPVEMETIWKFSQKKGKKFSKPD